MRQLLSELFSIYSCLNLFFLSFLNFFIEKNTFGHAQHSPMIRSLPPLHIMMQKNKKNIDKKRKKEKEVERGRMNIEPMTFP